MNKTKYKIKVSNPKYQEVDRLKVIIKDNGLDDVTLKLKDNSDDLLPEYRGKTSVKLHDHGNGLSCNVDGLKIELDCLQQHYLLCALLVRHRYDGYNIEIKEKEHLGS